jgi:hypothetical protein
MNACDPDADIENLRKLIKLNTGVDIKLTKKEICERLPRHSGRQIASSTNGHEFKENLSC